MVLLLSLGLGAQACKKDGSSTAPGGGQAEDDGMHLTYAKDGFSLATEVTMSLEVAGMASGTMEVSAKGTIEGAPHDGGKFKVKTRVDEVAKYEASGDLKPKAEEGQEPPDMKSEIVGAETFLVTDALGEADEEASEALAENVKKKEEAEKAEEDGDENAQQRMAARAMGGSVLTLPNLPEVGLEEGKEIKVPTKEEERSLGGRKLPVEVDSTYHLTKIDSSSGSRIATLEFKREGSGADEMDNGQGGSVFVAYEEETEGTLLFDLDAMVPVSMSVEQATAISFGDNAVEQYFEIEAKYAKQ